MRNTIFIIPLIVIFSCGGNGIEGHVDEPITFTAKNPEDSQDVDYFWSLLDQPDGSLINSGDLISSDDGQEMVFTPDYPGDYLIEVNVTSPTCLQVLNVLDGYRHEDDLILRFLV